LDIKNPPEKLYVLGDEKILNNNSVAIVGTRDIDEYGVRAGELFAKYLSQKNITIISGLAVGCDTIAHLNSYNKPGKTIAVIAAGFKNIYPKQNQELAFRILESGGAIISEYPPEQEVVMTNFPIRNRIIAGMSLGIIIVEAKERSGSTLTGRLGFKQGKIVFCIPGNIDDVRSRGCNLLISEGAYLVTTPLDVIDVLHLDEKLIIENEVEEEYQEVYERIGKMPISPDDIVKATAKSITEVNEILFMLEIEEKIEKVMGGRYIRSSKRRY